MRAILISGINGFLGSHIAKNAVEAGFSVKGLVRENSNLFRIRNLIEAGSIELFVIERGTLDDIVKKSSSQVLIHTATEYGRDGKSVANVMQANLAFPIELIRSFISAGGETFINTDSYFNKPQVGYSELMDYSLSKKALLQWLKRYSEQIGIVNLQLEHVYGNQDHLDKFVPYCVEQIAIQHRSQLSLTFGHQKRDFVHVEDCSKAFLKVASQTAIKNGYSEFQIGTGVSTEVREIPSLIKSLSHSSTDLQFGALPYRSDEIMDSKSDQMFNKVFGWAPRVTLDEGLDSLINHRRQLLN